MKEVLIKEAKGFYEVIENKLLRVWMTEPYMLSICISARLARRNDFSDEEDTQLWARRLLARLQGVISIVDSNFDEFSALYASYKESENELFKKYLDPDNTSDYDSERQQVLQRINKDLAHRYTRLFDEYIVKKGIEADGWRVNREVLSDIMHQRLK